MRRSVLTPWFYLAVALSSATAYGAAQNSLDEFRKNANCQSPSQNLDQKVCYHFDQTVCAEDGAACGRADNMPTVDWEHVTDANAWTVGQQIVAQSQGFQKEIKDACAAANPDVPDGTIAASENGVAAANKRKDTAGLEKNAQQAGVCRARIQICTYYFKHGKEALNHDFSSYSSLAAALDKGETVFCHNNSGLTDKDPYGKAQEYEAATKKDDEILAKTGSLDTPKDGTAPKDGDTPPSKSPSSNSSTANEKPSTKKSSSGGLGGINPMSLMQAMQGMMNQNQNQQTPPQTPQITPCDPSSGNGAVVCGAPTAAAAAGGSDSWNKDGKGGQLQSASADHGSFNPASIKDNAPTNVNTAGDPAAAKPGKAQTVANGGGQMLGGGGNTQPASLGGGGGSAGGGVGVHGSVADIDHGFQGRSAFAAQVQAMDASAGGGGGGWSGYGRGDSLDGIPLADFLPGRRFAPHEVMRGLAGGNARNIQIQSKDVNIWNRISSHILDRCNKGLLRDCIP